MKKIFLKLTLSVFAAVMLFTSCLGDGNQEFGRSNAFAYITTYPYDGPNLGRQCAAVDNVYLTSDLIETLERGKCYLLSYTVNTSGVSGAFYKAQITEVPQLLSTTYGEVGVPDMENAKNPTLFQPQGSAFDFFGDNWAVAFKMKAKEKDSSRAYFFYNPDPDAQYEILANGDKKAVGANQMIIDVRFDYIPGADTGVEAERPFISVGNLSRIKSEYRNSTGFEPTTGEYTVVFIKFRYTQLQSDGTSKEVYVGSWTEGQIAYGFYIDN